MPAVSSGVGGGLIVAVAAHILVRDARPEATVWVAADVGAAAVGVGCAVTAVTTRVAMTTTSVVTGASFPGGASYRYPSAAPDTAAELSSETL